MVAVLQPVQQGRIITVDRAVVLIGRSSDCDAVITGSQKISRRHCCLVQVDDTYYVRDLGSMNGVWLNGDRVNREARMSAGDRLAIGDLEFLFHPNARIEQKKTVATAIDAAAVDIETAAPGDNGNAVDAAPPVDIIDDVIPLNEVEELEEEVFELDNGAFVVEEEEADVEDALLVETNEVEVIDEPIVDIDDDDSLDEIVVFDDDD